ncbi:hypothetical protein FYK55_00920 [Roseiconus nitratireducens]|uniref:Uncharacterized protein n=1 Tax=Roseiconus nitratireducens TaxID=2605748 RepID=A0A5M6DL84_9BACT|nr:hypothetical protein [Roseiconus nitratireducens]KAA5547012.1 hypothetical protein FYK55_00920 [Roseiconus nitratireducens]
MAGDWIKVETTTCDKPEVFIIADELGIDPDAVVGKLIRVWIWADQQTFNGNAGSVTRSLLDRLAGVSGFADAMIKCGWLTFNGDGLTFPNFERHNGKTAKTRALTRKRVQNHRNAQSVTDALPEKRRDREEIHTPSNDGDARAEVTSSKNRRGESRKMAAVDYSRDFERWWVHYPRKQAKFAASKAFVAAMKAIQSDHRIDRDDALVWLIKRTRAYSTAVADTPPDKVAHPATWLNGRRFEDELPSEVAEVRYAKPEPINARREAARA